MNRKILINNQYPSLKYSSSEIEMLFHSLDSFQEFSIPAGELSIVFLDDPSLARLHDQFLGDPSTTDVMTFPGNSDHASAGEICVSVDHALRLSKELPAPFFEELTLYLVHGWLHLAGLNDIKEYDRTFMRQAETSTLAYLKDLNTIPNFSLS